jgi:hypothetical protein
MTTDSCFSEFNETGNKNDAFCEEEEPAACIKMRTKDRALDVEAAGDDAESSGVRARRSDAPDGNLTA